MVCSLGEIFDLILFSRFSCIVLALIRLTISVNMRFSFLVLSLE